MKAEQYDEVESQIGYDFKNRLLLQQAFTRKSYTQETHDGENNEVLEFIGDKVAQKGYFSFPDYVFNEDHDNNGNPVWTCECHIDEYEDYYYDTASSKKESKRLAAYHMLLSILNHENGRCD